MSLFSNSKYSLLWSSIEAISWETLWYTHSFRWVIAILGIYFKKNSIPLTIKGYDTGAFAGALYGFVTTLKLISREKNNTAFIWKK